tara:strand:+ start:550 stop:1824 length:1275 start_codon:yes stop_codon:yes gene_type:complete
VTTALAISTAILAILLFFAVSAIWSMTHLRRGQWKTLDTQDSRGERFGEMVARLTLSCMTEGNAVELFQNGAFFDRLEEAIGAADQSVHFETFLWKTGELSARLVRSFVAAAERGVEVRMILDGEGGKKMSETERQTLRDAGVMLCFFNPRSWRNIGTYNARDHRKMVVVDSRLAFVGGHCVTDEWQGDAQDRKHYRDITAQVRGPVVGELQAAFTENWTEVTGKLLAGEKYFPDLEPVGDARAHLAYVNVQRRVSAVKALHILAIASAQESVTIQNPYFLPDEGARTALLRAVERGVRVRVMTPTIDATDNGLVLHAMRSGLRPLLEGGVEIYGYDRTLLHQKVLTVDGHWSLVGSTNFDFRSFEINDEISVSLFDEDLAAELVRTFEEDLAHCHRYTLAMLEKRTVVDRSLDRLAWVAREQL